MGGAFSSIVYFESAQRDGYYLGMKSNGTVADASSIVPEAKEAQFTIIADVCVLHSNVTHSTHAIYAYIIYCTVITN